MTIENFENFSDYHILPIRDLKPHIDSPDCPCRPKFDDRCWIHNSFDRREALEKRHGRVRKHKEWFVIHDGTIIGLKDKRHFDYGNFSHYPHEG